MAKIKVLRLIEYTYDSVETMDRDMSNWQVQGTLKPRADVIIKSVTLPLEVLWDNV